MPRGECNLASGDCWTEAIWQIRDFKNAIAQFFLFYVECRCSRLSLFLHPCNIVQLGSMVEIREVVRWRSTRQTTQRGRGAVGTCRTWIGRRCRDPWTRCNIFGSSVLVIRRRRSTWILIASSSTASTSPHSSPNSSLVSWRNAVTFTANGVGIF